MNQKKPLPDLPPGVNTRDDPEYWESLATRIHQAAREHARAGIVPTTRRERWVSRSGVVSTLAVGLSAAALLLAIRLPVRAEVTNENETVWATALSSRSLLQTFPGVTRSEGGEPTLAALMLSDFDQLKRTSEDAR